ncbi:hypothetical protein OG563_25925 [Nocardia vinacea]|uniref:Uncharacterized protein n=1 Tax=Nocardia vinacea TaxID=96468 RepID=A0ABZ1YLQ6_9NOCA|nr:hypothetical protein [Nocardia vinacea]
MRVHEVDEFRERGVACGAGGDLVVEVAQVAQIACRSKAVAVNDCGGRERSGFLEVGGDQCGVSGDCLDERAGNRLNQDEKNFIALAQSSYFVTEEHALLG